MKLHKNIPVFVVHEGCPHMCVFCSQCEITGGYSGKAELENIKKTVETALTTVGDGVFTEIAFFGGSFTAIERSRMIGLLEAAFDYKKAGRVNGIRLSTRPDCIDDEILDILEEYGVTAIELGVQSMNDRVLEASKRGHTADDTRKACSLIKKRGCFELVGQMMTGLPESTPRDEQYTAEEIVKCGATHARIYPTVVIDGTELAEMQARGEYIPPTAEQQLERCAEVLRIFNENKVEVIRIGLQDVEEMHKYSQFDGAFGERVRSKLYYSAVKEAVVKARELKPTDKIEIFVPDKYISRLVGQKRENIERLRNELGLTYIKIRTDNTLSHEQVYIKGL